MAGSGRYELYVVKVDTTLIDELTSAGFAPNNQLQSFRPLGNIDPTANVNFGANPAFQFTTLKVGTALANIGVDGLDSASGVELGFIELSQGGGHEAVGHKITATKCLLVPNSLVANQDGLCELSYIAIPYSSDGTTHPLAHNAALPTGTPAVDELFTLADVTINSVALNKVVSWSIDFGLAPEVLKDSGKLYGTAAIIRSRNPVAEVVLADLDDLSTARLKGSDVSSVVFNLKKMSTVGSGYEGSGDKTVTIAKAQMEVTGVNGSFPGDGNLSFRFTARKGVDPIIAVA
jgi:hypothetical protein